MKPFFVLGTPRSRTAWLSSFLSYDSRPCFHEPCRFWSGMDALEQACADDYFSCSDSALTLRWRDIVRLRPDAEIVVVRRPVPDVVDSVRRLCGVDTRREVQMIDACIVEMIRAGIGDHVDFDDLDHAEVCAQIFQRCHDVRMPRAHWKIWSERNVQADVLRNSFQALSNPGFFQVFPEFLRSEEARKCLS